MRPTLASSLSLLLLSGCASGPRGPAPAPSATAAVSPAPTRIRRSQNVISEEEIAENPGILNAYDLIQRLRPNYLRGTSDISGTSVVGVRVDAGPQREVSDLRNIDVRQVKEIRYYSAQEANVRFGVDTNIPLIAISMKQLRQGRNSDGQR